MTKRNLNKFIQILFQWTLICFKALLCMCSFVFLSKCLFYDSNSFFDNLENSIMLAAWSFQFLWAYNFVISIANYINSNLTKYSSVLKTDRKNSYANLKYKSHDSLKLSKDNNIILIILCIMCYIVDMLFIYVGGTLGYLNKLLPYFSDIIWFGTMIFTTYSFVVYLIMLSRRVKVIKRFLSQRNQDE